jgi:CRP/FNR family transcriptional regulator, cyclic AMP receptor protein
MPSRCGVAANIRGLLDSTGTPFTVARYPPGASLFRQGDPCESVMYLETGRVWLAVTTADGKEAICGLLAEGAFLGDEALGGYAVRRQTATAMTTTEVLVVAKTHLIRLLETQPALAERVIAHLLARTTRLEADLTDQLLYSSEARLVHALLVLAGCDERDSRPCKLPRVSQEIIAEMVGTTRSRVNIFMGKFKRLGLITDNGDGLYLQPARLHTIDTRYRPVSQGHRRRVDTAA